MPQVTDEGGVKPLMDVGVVSSFGYPRSLGRSAFVSRQPSIENHVKSASDHVLNEVITNDWNHDAWVGRQRQRGQYEAGSVVIHSEAIHERDHFVLLQAESTTQPKPHPK